MYGEKNKQRMFGKDFWFTWIVAMLNGLCMRMLDTNMAPYAAYTWDSNSMGGWLTSIFTVGSVVMAFFSGKLSDTKGRKNCVLFSGVLFGTAVFIMFLFPAPAVTLVSRMFQGCAKGLIMATTATIVADVVSYDRLNMGMGIFGIANTLSYAFGPMLGLALVGENNYMLMFIVCAAMYGMVAVMSLGITYEKKGSFNKKEIRKNTEAHAGKEYPADAGNADKGRYKGIWKMIEKNAVLPSLNLMVAVAGYAAIVVFLTAYSKTILGFDGGKISPFYMAAAAGMLVIRVFISRLADRYGALVLLVPGHLCLAGCLIILIAAAKDSYIMYLMSGAMFGIGNSCIYPGLNTVAVVDSPEDRSGAANATINSMMDIGMFASAAVMGGLLDAAESLAVGYLNMFTISICIVVISLVISILLFNNRARARRNRLFAEHMDRVKKGILD